VLLIVDANVLIDYLQADEHILVLAGRHLGTLHVVREVVDEVEGLDDDRCAELGLFIVEATTEQLLEAGRRSTPGLSFEDTLCLILARENRWTCVTNDRALRGACAASEVQVLWGLQLMAELVAAGGVSAKAAVAAAEAIHLTNPAHISKALVAEFSKKLRGRV
jgi:predicted nucleic acid-binding protein